MIPSLQEDDEVLFNEEFLFQIKYPQENHRDITSEARDLTIIRRRKMQPADLERRLQLQSGSKSSGQNQYGNSTTFINTTQQVNSSMYHGNNRNNSVLNFNNHNQLHNVGQQHSTQSIALKPLPNGKNYNNYNNDTTNTTINYYNGQVDQTKQYEVHLIRITDRQKRSLILEYMLCDLNITQIQADNRFDEKADVQGFVNKILGALQSTRTKQYNVQLNKYEGTEATDWVITEQGAKVYDFLKLPMQILDKETTITQLVHQVTRLESDNGKLSSELMRIGGIVKKQEEALSNQSRAAQQYEDTKSSEFERIQNEHQKKLLEQQEHSRTKLEKLKQDYEQKLNALQQAHEKKVNSITTNYDKMNQDRSHIKNVAQTTANELEKANDKLKHLQARFDELETAKMSLQSSHDKKAQEFHELSLENSNDKKTIHNLEVQIAGLTASVESMDSRMKEKELLIANSESTSQSKQGEIARLKKDLKEYNDKLVKSKKQIKALTQDKTSYKGMLEEFKKVLKKQETTVNQLKEEKNTLQMTYTNESHEHKQSKHKLVELQKKVDDLTQANDQLMANVEKLKQVNFGLCRERSEKNNTLFQNTHNNTSYFNPANNRTSYNQTLNRTGAGGASNMSGISISTSAMPPRPSLQARSKTELFNSAIQRSSIQKKSPVTNEDDTSKENQAPTYNSHVETIQYNNAETQSFE